MTIIPESRPPQEIADDFNELLGRMRNPFQDGGPGADVISQYALNIEYPEPTVANPFSAHATVDYWVAAERAIREMRTSAASTSDQSTGPVDVSKVADRVQQVTQAAVHRDIKDVVANDIELLKTPALVEFVKIISNDAITMDDVIDYANRS